MSENKLAEALRIAERYIDPWHGQKALRACQAALPIAEAVPAVVEAAQAVLSMMDDTAPPRQMNVLNDALAAYDKANEQ